MQQMISYILQMIYLIWCLARQVHIVTQKKLPLLDAIYEYQGVKNHFSHSFCVVHYLQYCEKQVILLITDNEVHPSKINWETGKGSGRRAVTEAAGYVGGVMKRNH